MILAHPDISNQIDFEIPYVNSLVIENRSFYRSVLADLTAQLSGEKARLVLSENDTPIPIAKHAELITEFIPFDMNQKTLLSKVTAVLERLSLDPDHYLQTQELIQSIENHILKLSQKFDCSISCTKLSMGTVLKSVGLELYSRHDHPLETLLDYLLLMRDLDINKLFILLNFRNFFDDMETSRFLDTVLDHGLRILMLESASFPLLEKEKRLTIDQDLCEF